MDLKKRNFVTQMVCGAIVAPLATLALRAFALSAAQQDGSAPGPPHTRDDPFPNMPSKADAKQTLKQNKTQIHDDVEKLFQLASELKTEVEKTDFMNVLSLGMLQKTEQIEKLAKQVRGLARAD
jgi:hypothetical protein